MNIECCSFYIAFNICQRSPSAVEFHEMFAGRKRLLISEIKKHCKFVLALPRGEQEIIINWLSAKNWTSSK